MAEKDEYNPNEVIVKWLRAHADVSHDGPCEECPYPPEDYPPCVECVCKMERIAAMMIESLAQEVEELQRAQKAYESRITTGSCDLFANRWTYKYLKEFDYADTRKEMAAKLVELLPDAIEIREIEDIERNGIILRGTIRLVTPDCEMCGADMREVK